MTLGILLPMGSSLEDMELHGQKERFQKYYLNVYRQSFEKVIVFSYKDSPLHRYFYSLALPLVKRKDFTTCDVFRCFHLSSTPPAIVGKILFNKKFVFNYNYDYKKWAVIEKKPFLVPLIQLLEQVSFRLANHIFVADERMAEFARTLRSATKITNIPNGVDVTIFRPALHNKKNSQKVILSVGRLEEQKNYGQLIAAVANISPKPHLIIIGRGALKETLVRQAGRLAVDMTIIDVVPHLELPKYYQSADVYVQPSLAEAPVKTLLEAMSCQCACVGTRVPGISGVLEDGKNGLLASLETKDLQKKIQQVLNNPKTAKKLGEQARVTIINRFNIKKMINKEISILKSI